VLEIRGEIDGCHAALTEVTLDAVAAGERRVQTVGLVWQRA
jgi:hypothetical protein